MPFSLINRVIKVLKGSMLLEAVSLTVVVAALVSLLDGLAAPLPLPFPGVLDNCFFSLIDLPSLTNCE